VKGVFLKFLWSKKARTVVMRVIATSVLQRQEVDQGFMAPKDISKALQHQNIFLLENIREETLRTLTPILDISAG
jgi:hypothetical protein